MSYLYLQLNESDSSDEGSGGEHDMDSDSGDYAPTAPTPDPDPTPAKVNMIGIDWTNIFNAAGFVSQSSLTCTLKLTSAIVVSLEIFRIQQHLKPCFVEQWMTTLNEMQCNRVCCDIVFKRVQKVMKQYKLLSKDKHRQPNELSEFLKDSFQEDALLKIKIRRADSAGGSIDDAASASCEVEEPDEGSDPTVPVNDAAAENVASRIS